MSRDAPSTTEAELITHERDYKAFNVIVRWSMVILASLLVGLTLAFATSAGLLIGLAVGVVLFIAGYVFLVRHEERQPLDPWAPGR